MSILHGKQQGIHAKTWFFDCHRYFLLTNQKYRNNRNDFFIDRVEKDVASLCLSGDELYDMVSEYGDIVFGFQFSKKKFHGFGSTHNWVK